MKPTEVFVLTDEQGNLLPPAVQATVLAKYSRSPMSAQELLEYLTEEDAEAFQEKWGVSYGHSSVAELCTMPYCFENVSIIASKFLEQYQRAGYSEKSTRYQVFSEESFINPVSSPLFPSQPLADAAAVLYRAYKELEKPVYEHLARQADIPIDGPVNKALKARAFDNLRYLLPAGTGTNLAAVLNARDARYMMSDLLGSPNPELRNLGEKMLGAARDVAPVFAMGVKPNDFEPPIIALDPLLGLMNDWWVKPLVIDGEPEAIERRFWDRAQQWHGLDRDDFAALMERRGKNPVPNLFKTIPIGFEIMMDYGAFRDLQRHRRCEQFVEPLRPDYGYVVPDDLLNTPFEVTYHEAMQKNAELCERLLRKHYSLLAVHYALPLGTCHRSIFQMDLKELYYIAELRTQPQGHISYRRVAWRMYEIAKEIYPSLMRWCRAIKPDQIGEHH